MNRILPPKWPSTPVKFKNQNSDSVLRKNNSNCVFGSLALHVVSAELHWYIINTLK